jgi:hypothetical protein
MELLLSIIVFVVIATAYFWLNDRLKTSYYANLYGDVVHLMRITESNGTIKAFTSSVLFTEISEKSFGKLSVEQATLNALKLFQSEAEIWRDTGKKHTRKG